MSEETDGWCRKIFYFVDVAVNARICLEKSRKMRVLSCFDTNLIGLIATYVVYIMSRVKIGNAICVVC